MNFKKNEISLTQRLLRKGIKIISRSKSTSASVYIAELLKKGIKVIGGNEATLISAGVAELLVPVMSMKTKFGTINFYCNGKTPIGRARTLLTKEPETIEWINSFNESDIFWDVGACVGVYSLYAALRKLSVLSFEPAPGNFYVLNKNIEANNMEDRISAFCIAFNDTSKIDYLYMSSLEIGNSGHSFAESIDLRGKPFAASSEKSMIGFSVDDFIYQFNPPFPNHIKIDVDGIENKIIKGAKNTLSDRRVKSILVELDSERNEYCRDVIEMIEDAGLKFFAKKLGPRPDDSKYLNMDNYIFIRQGT